MKNLFRMLVDANCNMMVAANYHGVREKNKAAHNDRMEK